jgi:DNA-binding beta-propeller fold protein YncE
MKIKIKVARIAARIKYAALVSLVSLCSVSANADVFVTNDGASTVTVYANSAAGNQIPLREFGVARSPRGIYVDAGNSEIFVASQGGLVNVYDINASGTPTALRTITLSGGDFQGIYVNIMNNEIFVADRDGFIHVYSRTATGAGAPLRSLTISGFEPRGVSVDASAGELYVTGHDDVLTFARTPSGATGPLRTITSALGDMSQITFDAANAELVVANHGLHAIRVWPRGANGAVSPTRSIIGLNTLLDSPRGVAVCDGEYFAGARNANLITVYAAGANGNATPQRTIGGAATQLNSPRFIACGSVTSTATNATNIPTMSAYGLVLTMMGLLFVAVRRLRTSAKPY